LRRISLGTIYLILGWNGPMTKIKIRYSKETHSDLKDICNSPEIKLHYLPFNAHFIRNFGASHLSLNSLINIYK
jgi:hypothetical protein